MTVQLIINGRLVVSQKYDKYSRDDIKEAHAYFKSCYSEYMEGNDWQIIAVIESKVSAEIRKLSVLNQRRSYYDRKLFESKSEPEPVKIDRSKFTNYSNKQWA